MHSKHEDIPAQSQLFKNTLQQHFGQRGTQAELSTTPARMGCYQLTQRSSVSTSQAHQHPRFSWLLVDQG